MLWQDPFDRSTNLVSLVFLASRFCRGWSNHRMFPFENSLNLNMIKNQVLESQANRWVPGWSIRSHNPLLCDLSFAVHRDYHSDVIASPWDPVKELITSWAKNGNAQGLLLWLYHFSWLLICHRLLIKHCSFRMHDQLILWRNLQGVRIPPIFTPLGLLVPGNSLRMQVTYKNLILVHNVVSVWCFMSQIQLDQLHFEVNFLFQNWRTHDCCALRSFKVRKNASNMHSLRMHFCPGHIARQNLWYSRRATEYIIMHLRVRGSTHDKAYRSTSSASRGAQNHPSCNLPSCCSWGMWNSKKGYMIQDCDAKRYSLCTFVSIWFWIAPRDCVGLCCLV